MLIVLRLTASLAYSSILFPIRDINNSYMLSFNKSVSVTKQPRGWLVVQPLSFHILDSGFWNLCILTAIRVCLVREVQVGAIFDRVTFLLIGYAGYGIQTSEFIWSASCFRQGFQIHLQAFSKHNERLQETKPAERRPNLSSQVRTMSLSFHPS